MKKLKPIITIFLFIALIMIVFFSIARQENVQTVQNNNQTQEALSIDLHHVQCPFCTMVVGDEKYAAQVASTSGRTWVFDDFGCMTKWLDDKAFVEGAPKIWVYAQDLKRWIDAHDAFYETGHTSPMGYGYAAFKKQTSKRLTYKDARKNILQGKK